jgi:hypothetical protein
MEIVWEARVLTKEDGTARYKMEEGEEDQLELEVQMRAHF